MNNQDTAQHVMSAIRDERLAIIDIGSNSIRMVIYHNAGIYPFPVFNERVTCRLGAALDKTGEMAQENMEAAFVALRRFAVILQSLQPDSVRVVATAAARRAQNASVFLDTATKILGQEIEVLPAEEEARLIALSLTANMPALSGVVADLGGGSLELVKVSKGVAEEAISLNFGHLSSIDEAAITKAFDAVPWLKACQDTALFGIGGSFRALGAAFVKRTDYPLFMLHGLTLSRKQQAKLLASFTKPKSDFSGVPADRMASISQAVTIISTLTSYINADRLFISGTSLRDGVVADSHHKEALKVNPLLASSYAIANHQSVLDPVDEAIADWLSPLASYYQDVMDETIIRSAAILADICWNEHPDMQGILAVDRILALPIYSLSHADRAMLAKIILHRYVGVKKHKAQIATLGKLLTKKQIKAAKAIGLAIRFARLYCAGLPDLLADVELNITETELVCRYPRLQQDMMDKHSMRRFTLLAEAMGRTAQFSAT